MRVNKQQYEPIDVPATIAKLTMLEKVELLAGDGWWHTASLPKHGIPGLRMSDGPLGVRGIKNFGGVAGNCYAGGVALAASFDEELAEELGRFVGEEARSKGAHVWLGPTLNIPRSPLYGRAFENFSEDPYLSGKFTAAMIRGAASKGVVATPKHFVCYEQNFEQGFSSSQVSERAMREIYMRPFQIAMKESPVKAIMTAYNRNNGTHCSENEFLLQDVLRKEWGFDGLIMSDWYGTYSTFEALNAGLDLEMPGPGVYRREALSRGVSARKVRESTLNRSVEKILNAVNDAIASGIPFDQPETFVDTPESRATLLKAAVNSVVLIKNDNANLPIQKDKVRKLAVIGPNAKVAHVCPGGSATLKPLYSITSLEGIEAYAQKHGVEVEYTLGAPAFKYLPRLERLARSPSGKREPFDFEFYRECPRQNPHAKPTLTIACETSEGLMYDEFSRDVVPRFCYMRLHTMIVPDESGDWEFSLILVGQGRLYLDDKLLVDNYHNQTKGDLFYGDGTVEVKGRVKLEKGKSYHLCLDFDNFNLVDGATTLQIFGAFRLGALKALPTPEEMIRQAVDLAKRSDAVVILAGLTSDFAEEGYDREHMRLPPGVDDMIATVLKANSNSTVVVQSGVQCEMSWRHDAASVVQAFYGGNEAGNGLAAVLFGDHNPSSRLPLTFPDRLEDVPSHPFFPGKNGLALYNEDVFVGYRHENSRSRPVIGAFGHGLSYTTFAMTLVGEPSFDPTTQQASLDVSVKNTGSLAGAEIVQVYVTPPASSLPRPSIELAAFKKVYLEPGQSKKVRLTLDRGAFSYWDSARDPQGVWVVERGQYTLRAGNSSANLPVSATINIDVECTWRGL